MNDEVPFDVISEYPETGDLSTQVGGDCIDPAKAVGFSIEKVEAKVKKNEEGEKLIASLNVRASVGALGVDGQGKYAGKNFFADLMTWFNPEVYKSEWWQKQARFPYKSFLKAIGLDPANPPKVTDEFIVSLKGQEFTADIRRVPITVKTDEVNAKGKAVYKETGDFKNELANFKAVGA